MMKNVTSLNGDARCTITKSSRPRICFRRNSHAPVSPRFLDMAQSRAHGKRSLSVIVRAEGDNDELPWERKERLQSLEDKEGKDVPFPVYLLGSAIIAIAAVGSIFEIINKNSIFGVLPPSNPLWLPILGVFAVTGIPSAGFLFLKAIKSANDASDRQNRADGY